MKLLNQLTLNNLRLNKRRSFMTIIGITLSVALIFTIITMVLSLKKTVQDLMVIENGKYHASIQAGGKHKEQILNHPDTDDYTVNQVLGYSKIDSQNEYKPYLKLLATDQEGFEDNNLKLIVGRFPQNDKELVISDHLRTNGDLDLILGDTIKLNLGKRVLVETSPDFEYNQDASYGLLEDMYVEGEKLEVFDEKVYEIVGIIERPNKSIEVYSEPGYSAFTYAVENPLYEDIFFSIKNPGNIEEYLNSIEGLELNRVSLNNRLLKSMGFNLGDGLFSMIFSLALILIGVIVVTSVMIIRNSFSISIVERTKEYGILKSLGASDKQVKNNILYEGLILGVIGSALGLALGILSSYILSQVVGGLLNQYMEGGKFVLKISFIAILTSLLLGFLTIYISTKAIAKRSIRFTPIEAIRGSHDIKVSKKDVKTPRFINKILDIGGLIAYKNLKRNKKKYRTTVISLALSVSIFIGMYSFVSSIERFTRANYSYMNFQITVNGGKEYNLEDMKELAEKSLDSEKYSIQYFMDSASLSKEALTDEAKRILKDNSIDDQTIYANIHEIDKETFDNLLEINSISSKPDALFVNRNRGQSQDKKYTFDLLEDFNPELKSTAYTEDLFSVIRPKLASIEKLAPGMKDYNDNFETVLYFREGYFNAENQEESQYRYGRIYIDSENPDQTAKNLEKYIEDNKIKNTSIYNGHEHVKLLNTLILLVQIFGYGFIIVITLIALTNVFNTITSNINSRRREFGSLISFGMSKGQLNKMVLTESFLIGSRSLVGGIALGIIISILTNLAISNQIKMPYKLPLLAIIISILVVLIITYIIMVYSLSKIRSNNVIEVIRNENI